MFNVGDIMQLVMFGTKVRVERDNGGNTVYISVVGTGKQKHVARGALIPIDSPKSQKSTSSSVGEVSKPAPKVQSNQSPLKQELSVYMREIHVYQGVLNCAARLGIQLDNPDPNKFGMAKMQLMNKIWAKLKSKELTIDQVWGNK